MVTKIKYFFDKGNKKGGGIGEFIREDGSKEFRSTEVKEFRSTEVQECSSTDKSFVALKTTLYLFIIFPFIILY